MKKRLFLVLIVAALCLSSCRAVAPSQPGTATPAPTWTAIVPTQTSAPADTPTATLLFAVTRAVSVEPFQDVRFQDLSALKVDLDRSKIETLWFNASTQWPAGSAELAADILERGKNPGLGVRSLHAQGITGEGVTVAIIDQNMVLDHPEFQGKVVEYKDVGTQQPHDQSSMHAPAVTSLLVGEDIGIAPGAKVYFAAAPSWTADAQYQADALNWIIDENENLPEGEKIRLVSISAAPSGPGTPFTQNNDAWDAAYARATAAGILVLDCTTNHGITAPCYYDLDDPENVAQCTPGWPDREIQTMTNKIYIPTSHRTTAEEYYQGAVSYQYTGTGGLSWSIPYLAGVLALGWQVRPELTNAQMLELLFATAYVRESGEKIIDPVAFIEAVRNAGEQ